jgi:glycine hydroxymethyltransferase
MKKEDAHKVIQEVDPDLYELIQKEEAREHDSIRLIASENYASRAVLSAAGSVFTNKYCEGYAGKRYYLGQDNTDALESLAIERAKTLFGADHVNVQPYSGSPANLAAFMAVAKLHDKMLALDLPQGGHLTHGWKVSATGKMFEASHYKLDPDTELLDYEAIRQQALELRPKILIAGHSAYPRSVDFKKFAEIAEESGSILIADMAHISGLVAGGVHQSPVPYADIVTTTTHKSLRGPRSGMILCKEAYAKAIDRSVFPGMQGGPHMHIVAALAVALKEALEPDFKKYAAQIVKNAKAMADEFQKCGYRLVTGGTDNHLLLVDLTNKQVTGKEAAIAMDKAGIICNPNTIPYDPRSPFNPSGIRIGTPAVTTRGMLEDDMRRIVHLIDTSIQNRDNDTKLKSLREEVTSFCRGYPTP